MESVLRASAGPFGSLRHCPEGFPCAHRFASPSRNCWEPCFAVGDTEAHRASPLDDSIVEVGQDPSSLTLGAGACSFLENVCSCKGSCQPAKDGFEPHVL